MGKVLNVISSEKRVSVTTCTGAGTPDAVLHASLSAARGLARGRPLINQCPSEPRLPGPSAIGILRDRLVANLALAAMACCQSLARTAASQSHAILCSRKACACDSFVIGPSPACK